MRLTLRKGITWAKTQNSAVKLHLGLANNHILVQIITEFQETNVALYPEHKNKTSVYKSFSVISLQSLIDVRFLIKARFMLIHNFQIGLVTQENVV